MEVESCVNRVRTRARVTQPSPCIFLSICTIFKSSCVTLICDKGELIYSDCNRRYPLTYHYPITEEQLVKLAGKRGEEAAEGGDQAAHDRRQPRRLPPADGHRHRRDQ